MTEALQTFMIKLRVFLFLGLLQRDVPPSQLLQSYIYGRYKQKGYKHDFEPSMIHPDPIHRKFSRFNIEDGQFDDASE